MPVQEPVSALPLGAENNTAMPWAVARQQLAESNFYWVATVRSEGRPHVMPVLAVWLEDALYFCTSPTTRKAKNLAFNSHCVITTETDEAHLVVEGEASRVNDNARLQAIAKVYATKYDWPVTIQEGAFHADGAPTAGPPPYVVYQISPSLVFGFGTGASFRPTRWQFQDNGDI